jgi:hypothetical protein
LAEKAGRFEVHIDSYTSPGVASWHFLEKATRFVLAMAVGKHFT